MLAPDQVSEAPEHQRAEGAHRETGCESGQREDESRDLVDSRKELRGNDGRHQTVQIEVVPLEHRTERRRSNDQPLIR